MGSWLFQSPAWLAAGLAALAVPLLIHFISRSRGVRIPFGNIRLVRSARRRLVHELRLTQLLLMMLRLSLVAISALILGGLANPGTAQQDGEVAYLTPQWLNQAKPGELASLVQAGKSVFVLTPGFPVPEPGDDDEPVGDDDIWPLLAERLSTVNHTGNVHVYSAGWREEFGRLQPPLPTPITWHFAEPSSKQPVAWPLEILLVQHQPPDERADAVNQALQLIQQYRLPGLTWQSSIDPDEVPAETLDALIWAVPGLEPGPATPGNGRWINLNEPGWEAAWRSADFPERLTDALLGPDQQAKRWARALVTPDALAPMGAATTKREQLPRQPLYPWLGFMLILLWGLERWLSERSADGPG